MSIPSSFVAAVVAQLQQSGACASAFGDSSQTPKFQGDEVFSAGLPYARVLDLPADHEFESADSAGLVHEYESGELQVDIFANPKSSARALGNIVAAALNDAPLVFADGQLLELRIARSSFVPEPDPGPGAVVVYHRVLLFRYRIQRSL